MDCFFFQYCQLGTNELQTAVVLGIDEAVASKMISNKKINVIIRFLTRLLILTFSKQKKKRFCISKDYIPSLFLFFVNRFVRSLNILFEGKYVISH